MKRIKVSISCVVMLFSLSVAWGQSRVSEVQNTYQDTAIVRYWKEGISIVYTQTWNDDNYFSLVDTAVSQVLRIPIVDNVKVNDFRILHDTVYMCGHRIDNSGTQQGWLAYFSIQDFYTGTGTYYWMATRATVMFDCYGSGYYNQVYDITRLAVYDDPHRGPQIAYICRNYIVGETTLRVGIGWTTNHLGLWNNYIIYNKDAEEEYTDIIATQNYVVAVGRNNVNAHLSLRVFPQSVFLVPTYVPYPGVPGVNWCYYYNTAGQSFGDLDVDEDVMATALNGDEFAVAYHYTESPQDGLAVKTFQIAGGTASLTQGLTAQAVRHPGSTWKMRDIGFSPQSKRLVVLNDFDGGTVGCQASIVYQFPLPTLLSGTYYGRYLTGYYLHALAPFGTVQDAYVATGNMSSVNLLYLYWEKYVASASCGQQDAIVGKLDKATYDTPTMTTNMNEPIPIPGNTPFVVEVIVRDEICILP